MKNKRKIGYVLCLVFIIAISCRIYFINRNANIAKTFHAGESVPYGNTTMKVVEGHWASEEERQEFIREMKATWKENWKDMLPLDYDATKDALLVVTIQADPSIRNQEISYLFKKGLSEQIGGIFRLKDKEIDAQTFQRFFPVKKPFFEFSGNVYAFDIGYDYALHHGMYANIEFEVKDQ